jgi:hypothetical protein
LALTAAASCALAACGGGISSPSVWDSMKGDTAKQIADRIKCASYSENRGPTFPPDEPNNVIAVAACDLPYVTEHGFVVFHIYPDRASGAQMRTVSEDVNGKGSTVWVGNTLLTFGSADGKKLAEAFAYPGPSTTVS